MANIDFVPDDYMQHRDSSRSNFLYLILFAAVMGAIGVTFSIIKIRQKAAEAELLLVNSKLGQAGKQVAQLEELKTKSKAMMKTMMMTSELLEPVPKSVILACLTNNLPGGVSLLKLNMVEKEVKAPSGGSAASSQYEAASAAAGSVVNEKVIETRLSIEGIAPSDIEVAIYISRLDGSILLDEVALVESKEHKIDKVKFREFKLSAILKRGILLTKKDVAEIRQRREKQS
jgi:Tfp pilus assembly protein PilN